MSPRARGRLILACSVVSVATSGALLGWAWTGDVRWAWTALVLFVVVIVLAASAQPARRPHPEDTCGRCAGPNITWCAPSPLWNAVMRAGGSIDGEERFGGIVCPVCFARLAEEQGVASMWRLTAVRVTAELETVTPSGRVWDAAAWLWVEPPARR